MENQKSKTKNFKLVVAILIIVYIIIEILNLEFNPAQEEALKMKLDKQFKYKPKQDKSSKVFNILDGSSPKLEKIIKQGMNDPDSYLHIRTSVYDKLSHYYVITEFKGKNKFGAVVKNTIIANIDYDGNVIRVLEQY